jgi:hypothetical protein
MKSYLTSLAAELLPGWLRRSPELKSASTSTGMPRTRPVEKADSGSDRTGEAHKANIGQ